jgi:hypothetical protein
MSIEISDQYKMKVSAVSQEMILGHLDLVLKNLAMKGRYSQFYIGITNNLEQRAREHAAHKPDFKLMCPIYEEQAIVVATDSFHNLERDAIKRFRKGVIHPDSQRVLLQCANGPDGSIAKNWLYIIVG